MSAAAPDEILLHRKGSAAWLTLNRPAALNALTPRMMAALDAHLAALEDDRGVRVIVLTGAGRAFCAGVDLAALGASTALAEATAAFMAVANPAVERLHRFPKPVVAAVNGVAMAGGLELILCCDLVVAASDARFGDGHANFGLVPAGGSTARLPRRVGVALAKYLIYTGAQIDAAAMREAGLVNQVVAPEGLEAAVDALVARLADKSPLGLARSKWLIDGGLDRPEAEAVRIESETSIAHSASRDVAEGLAAFAAKRRPVFTGE